MKYMLLIYEEDADRVAHMDERMPTCFAYAEAMKKAGIYVTGEPLRAIDIDDHRARDRWPDPRDRRALCGGQGAARRIPHHRRARPRHRARVGGALPEREPRRGRGPADLAGRGLSTEDRHGQEDRCIALGALVAVLIAVIALQPCEFAIERATVIAAPPEVVFAHLDSPKAMDVWSPWVKMDPEQKLTHEGPESGVGASESWEGPQIGAGRLTITGVKPNEEVEMRLEFTKPMQATNRALFTLTPVGDGTRSRGAWRARTTSSARPPRS